jgi:tRNA (cmo5U34)-methyltransferase
MRKKKGFDFLAPVYDRLAQFVFGKSITDTQTCFLETIPPHARVLILGGGTGWLLKKLEACNSSCVIWYVENSFGMMKKARLHRVKNLVHFIEGTEEAIPIDLKFDVVITNFYLDLFADETLKCVIDRINTHVTPSSTWLVSEFIKGSTWWHHWMLKVMYLFFRNVCDIEANQLPEWQKQLGNQGWEVVSSKPFYHGFIHSTVWHYR